MCYRFSLFDKLSLVRHCVLQVSTVVSGPILCVTYSCCYQRSNTVCYRFPLLSAVQHRVLQVYTVISGPTLYVTYSRCYQRSNTVCYRFPLLSAVQHCVLHIPTVISGPTLCVTYSHCHQWSNTVCYIFPLLSAVQHYVLHIPTLISVQHCVTGFHCYQRSNTVCYRFPVLSVVQHSPSFRRQVCLHRKHRHFALDHLAVPGRGHGGHPVAIQRPLRGSGCHEQPWNLRGFARLPAESLQRSQRRHRAPPGDPQRHGQLLCGGHGA